MNELLLKFKVNLKSEDYQKDFVYKPKEVLFHRFLPNGIKDALEIEYDEFSKIKLFFERYGVVADTGYIRFDYDMKDVDSEVVERQAVLDGGPLFGLIELENVDQNEYDAVVSNKIGDDSYVRLGKRLVTNMIYPYVKRMIDHLSLTYGQYWLGNLKKWDSRERSIGYYCSSVLGLKWSNDGGSTWNNFLPSEVGGQVISASIVLRTNVGEDYLHKEDWSKLEELIKSDFEHSLGASVLSKAHINADQGNLKYALIEAVTALEIAMGERVNENLKGNNHLIKSLDRFWKLPMPAKLTTISSLLGNISVNEIETSIEVISVRNAVMHEASDLPPNLDRKLKVFMNVISKILIGPEYRFPMLDGGNALIPKEELEVN
ncbi:hypothetical protein [Priestia megaterium]|uniref:hypothetical protein n=1 Tax=Priestia megaterium TaxID=1404 RepID=UPI001784AE30|nr:hypothetical protein [Priestia megaterium]MBD8847320.1 hypothetical protein [Priestia megaterium]